MKYLIFRTDRIGDFLITSPLIHALKNNNNEAKIYVVTSNKNNEFIKNYNFVDKVFLLRKNNLFNKIKLYYELKKFSFDAIIVSDKKNRSIILTLFLNSKKKIFNVSKILQKKILEIFFKHIFLDNDDQINDPIKKILINNCNSLNIDIKSEDFHYLKNDQFLDNFFFNEELNIDRCDYAVIHCDEKWELENYSKAFKKASSFTDLMVDAKTFTDFLANFTEKRFKNIIITTGTINVKLVDELKFHSEKINDNLYKINIKSGNVHLLINQDFFSISHLISKCKLFISCHGAFTHIAANYNVKILDIIESTKLNHYNRITSHIKKYVSLNRENFAKLSKIIINNS